MSPPAVTPPRSVPAEIREAPGGESRYGSAPSSVGTDLYVLDRLLGDARFVEQRSGEIAARLPHPLTAAWYFRAVEDRERLEALRAELSEDAA